MNSTDDLLQEAYASMASLCSRSEHCSFDIRSKIVTKGLEADAAEEILAKLIEDKFIDDERYIRSYISDKFRFNRWGRVKMRHYLRMKNLPDHLIEAGLNEIEMEKYKETLLKTLKEKARSVKTKDKYEKMGQIIRFAQNRGFEPELIHRYLNEVLDHS